MRRKREAGKPVVSQIVPDFVSDLGLAVTYDKTLTAIKTVWNSLPSGIRDSSSAHSFHRLLKTCCFQQNFGSP